MNIPSVFWLVPIASIVALGMAWFFFTQMMKEDEGTPRMKEIALYVRKGAMAYLKKQYKVVGIERVGNGAKVTVENLLYGRKRVLEALEQ